jgi:acyl carrier protein
MKIEDFIIKFAAQFDETPQEKIKAETVFRELDEWSSLIALSIIAMADEEFDVKISGEEIRTCITVNDVFNNINSKIK